MSVIKELWLGNIIPQEDSRTNSKEILEEKAYSSYRTMSRYLRDCALDKEIIVVTGADTIADELRRIGNNLNQLTRA